MFALTSYSEYYTGMGFPNQCLELQQYPIVSISRVATYPAGILNIVNNSAANQRATIATDQNGVTLYSVNSAVPTTVYLTWAQYPTVALLAAAINALNNGWFAQPTVGYEQYASADFKPGQGAINVSNNTNGYPLELYTEDLSFGWRSEPDTGCLYGFFPAGQTGPILGGYGASPMIGGVTIGYGLLNIRVDYIAGFATIPIAIQQACLRMCVLLYQDSQTNPLIKSSKLGPYSREYFDRGESLVNQSSVLSLIYPYINHAGQLGRI